MIILKNIRHRYIKGVLQNSEFPILFAILMIYVKISIIDRFYSKGVFDVR